MQNSISFCRNIYISGTFTTLKSVRKINIVTILIIFLLPQKNYCNKIVMSAKEQPKRIKILHKMYKVFYSDNDV